MNGTGAKGRKWFWMPSANGMVVVVGLIRHSGIKCRTADAKLDAGFSTVPSSYRLTNHDPLLFDLNLLNYYYYYYILKKKSLMLYMYIYINLFIDKCVFIYLFIDLDQSFHFPN